MYNNEFWLRVSITTSTKKQEIQIEHGIFMDLPLLL
jgi:hypothetical protein